MIQASRKQAVLEEILRRVELPESAYVQARRRYDDLGGWLERDGSSCGALGPHIFAQGSFRLGTAIRPLGDREEYDLDLACSLEKGITRRTHSQFHLKTLVGHEIKEYRTARGISDAVEEKHRCWRLCYQDKLSFHMDIVPCIPSDDTMQQQLKGLMEGIGLEQRLAGNVAARSVHITDNRKASYATLSDDWLVSNPEGYALWFESRMALGQVSEHAVRARVDDVPVYRKKGVLQCCVQLLKRHRDVMFRTQPDVKPISIIITTLAARSYSGENVLADAMGAVLARLGDFVNNSAPRVPNPTNPGEDFADRWGMPEYAHLHLERNFRAWLAEARKDFGLLGEQNVEASVRHLSENFGLDVGPSVLEAILAPEHAVAPKPRTIHEPARPWRRG